MSHGIHPVRWAREQQGLRPNARLVLLTLASHCNGDRTAWPSRATLATETGLHEETVRKLIRFLERGGYILVRPREGHSNEYMMGAATQPTLLDLARQPPQTRQRAVGGYRHVAPRGSQQNVGGKIHRSTKIIRSPDGDRTPAEVEPMTEPALTLQACRQRFLASDNRKEQVAALVDASRLLFTEPLAGGRAAAFVGRYGHGQNVIDALMAAAGHGAAGPADYMEKVLQGSKQRREGGQRVASGEAVTRFVERREEMWG